jgi:hypothetical protein
MKFLYSFFIAVVLLTLGSCKKFLDTNPTDFLSPSTYYQTETQLDFALNGVYDVLGSSKLYGANLHSYQNMEADEGFYSNQTSEGIFTNRYTSGDVDVREFWRALYLGVSRANIVLANVDNNLSINETIRNKVRGEALFLRAYYYFLLVQNFGDIPLYLEPLKAVDDVDVAVTPAKEVYELIIEDMETAEALVDPIEAIGFGGRVSKSAVRGILARVCLTSAGYPVRETDNYAKASYWAKKVIDDSGAGHSLNPDYKDVFINYAQDKYDIKESIWEVEFWGYGTGAEQEFGYVGSWIGIQNTSSASLETNGYSFGRIVTTAKLYKTFENGDLRRDWNIAPFLYRADGSKSFYPANPERKDLYRRNAGKYRREYELGTAKVSQATPINFPLLRFSDVLLMYAEAEYEDNNGQPTPDAIQHLNLVRRRAFGHLLPGADPALIANNDLPANIAPFDFFNAIINERSRELCFEALRKADLVRWGIYFETMKDNLLQINRDLGEGATQGRYYRNISEQHVVYPKPAYELELNRKLVQHPLWR